MGARTDGDGRSAAHPRQRAACDYLPVSSGAGGRPADECGALTARRVAAASGDRGSAICAGHACRAGDPHPGEGVVPSAAWAAVARRVNQLVIP